LEGGQGDAGEDCDDDDDDQEFDEGESALSQMPDEGEEAGWHGEYGGMRTLESTPGRVEITPSFHFPRRRGL
jgi:hypothetical protein